MAFEGLPREGFRFLMELRYNNNREWFTANRDRFTMYLKEPLYALVGELSESVLAVDEDIDTRPARVVSHIYRDARRVRGGDFYRDVLWFSFKRRQNEDSAKSFSIYFYMNPEEYGWGCGFYEQNTRHMNELRARISACPERFLDIVGDERLSRFTLNGEPYKRQRFSCGNAEADKYMNLRTVNLDYARPVDKAAFEAVLCGEISGDILAMKDFYRFVMGMDI